MPLRPARVGRPGVIGGPWLAPRPVVGTAAVVSHGVDRRQGRREVPPRRQARPSRTADGCLNTVKTHPRHYINWASALYHTRSMHYTPVYLNPHTQGHVRSAT